MIVLGVLAGLQYMLRQLPTAQDRPEPSTHSRTQPITRDHILDMALVGMVLGIIGTRAVYVALHWNLFRDAPIEAFQIWTGGLSFIGGPLFGFAWAWWYCRRHNLSFAAVGDLAAPAFALAYSIGRIGCFLNGCCYGRACSLPWAVRFDADGLGHAFTPPSHPTQLYASAMSLVIFGILHRMRKKPHRDGQILLAYATLYAAYRFINDFFRAGASSRFVFGWLTEGQLAALIAVPVLAFIWWRMARRSSVPQRN